MNKLPLSLSPDYTIKIKCKKKYISMEIFNEKYKTIVYKLLGKLDNRNYTV